MPQNKHLTNKMRIKGGAKTPALDPYHAAQKFLVELDEGTPAQYIMENEVFRKQQAADSPGACGAGEQKVDRQGNPIPCKKE